MSSSGNANVKVPQIQPLNITNPVKKPKVVVFDLDETLGHFGQLGIFFDVIDEYFNDETLVYKYFNELLDLYPEIFRPNIVRILSYIRKKKQEGICSKVMVYTNNQGPPKWTQYIRDYLEKKIVEAGGPVSVKAPLPLFDRIIGGFKAPTDDSKSDSHSQSQPQRTTGEKTINDFLRCSRLPSNVEICFLDDLLHQKMVNEKVYYIKLQSYRSHIPFDQFVSRFTESQLYAKIFSAISTQRTIHATSAAASAEIEAARSASTTTSRFQIQKRIALIEMTNMITTRVKALKYDLKHEHIRVNPREIDEIISKYILFHLQQFFKEQPTEFELGNRNQQQGKPLSFTSKNKTRKSRIKGMSGRERLKRVFIVDKITALKAQNAAHIRTKSKKNNK
jgi:hypothetical protein